MDINSQVYAASMRKKRKSRAKRVERSLVCKKKRKHSTEGTLEFEVGNEGPMIFVFCMA